MSTYRKTSRKNPAIASSMAIVGIVWLHGNAWAFDDDVSINYVEFRMENFIDIKAYQFRKAQDEQWHETRSGWRMKGGSLSTDTLYLHTEFRFNHAVTQFMDIRMSLDQETFYDDKPFPLPLLEIGWHDRRRLPVDFAFLATAAHNKRESDLGAAITYGDRPWNYVRLAWLDVDHYYNEKNIEDMSRYTQQPRLYRLEGAWSLSDNMTFRIRLERNMPLELMLDDMANVFRHKGYRYDVTANYYYQHNYNQHSDFIGLRVRGFEYKKTLTDTTSDREQLLEYTSLDVYWVNKPLQHYELTTGIQYDRFIDEKRDDQNARGNSNFRFRTWQMYGALYHQYSMHQAWDLGLYAGRARQNTDYITGARPSILSKNIEVKLRTSWEYRSMDNKTVFTVHFGFNMDELFSDPGNGGGMSFMTTF